MFEDVINLLLNKKANLSVEKELALQEATEKVNAEFDEREIAIDKALADCGYVESVNASIVEDNGENVSEENDVCESNEISEETPV